LRELAATAFSDISKAVTWGPSAQVCRDGKRAKLTTSPVLLVLRDKIDESTAAAIAAVSQSPTGSLSIKMHDKLAALIALGKHLGMFVQRAQNPNVHYFVSDEPMSPEEWEKEFVTKN
jgi:phage terminase small subunit